MPGPGFFLIGDEEKKEVIEVLEGGYLSRYGQLDNPRFKKKVITLEKTVAGAIGVNYCIAVNSGTSALMAALVGLGVGPGDEVLVPGYTFVASISAIIAIGGKPVLTEIDNSYTMDPNDAERKITKRTKVIMPVHLLGYPCDMEKLMDIAGKNNLMILEDGCQAMGSTYKGKKLGSIGDVGVFSLNIFKTLTSGEGGFITTDNKTIYERAYGFHDQGFSPLRKEKGIGNWSIVGINLKMNELTGAFLLGQMKKLDGIMDSLKVKKQKFKEAIRDGGIKNIDFERLNDPGEGNMILTIRFKNASVALRAAESLGIITLSQSGWHVYNNMHQIINYEDSEGKRPYRKNMLPQTDDLLSRSINLSVGVINPGLGSGVGISILSSGEEIQGKAAEITKILKPIVD